ncbi:Glutathione transport system permease protein GsiC [Roseovarius albus]|uniref:Glutathione transport system permease protein GsiC n=1 Tax=Roseovarius albus TaxID=1247867 RepID=A0A1X6ZLG2_9RHOB|nr:ABC transporter permease [Roseovarius albus]SLN54871.1 Glutathione transport system permease protein GsiC [Roseovarius albus]
MFAYIIKRIGLGILVLLLAISSLYMLIQAAPGDPASAMLGPRATPALKAAITEKLGLDKPMPIQIFNYLISVLQGDLGTDLKSKQPVWNTLSIHMPRTLELLGASVLIAALVGIPLGCVAAVRRNSMFDRVIGVFSVSVIAVPAVIIAIFGMLIFAAGLGWVPAIGAGEDEGLMSLLHHLILPAFAVGVGWIGYIARLVRASMIEVLSTNYIRNARAFGLPARMIIYRYALRIAVAPTITVIGIGVGVMMGSAVFVEIVFARPGIGKLMYEAVLLRNYPVSLGAVMAASFILIVSTTLSDILNALIDPRFMETGE